MANRELSKAEWLDKAQAYCARAEHCAADVRRKLFEWGAPADLFDEIEENLYSNDFLNDARFCRAYVHDKVEYQAWGRLKIKAGLQEIKYFSNLRNLISQRAADSEEKRLRFLLQRGFTYDDYVYSSRLQ